MSFQKIILSSILLYLAVFGYANAQRISIPLIFDPKILVGVPLTYGSQPCTENAAIDIENCSATTLVGSLDQCGATLIDSKYRQFYISPFQLGNTSTILSFQYKQERTSTFCLGVTNDQNDILVQLFQSGKISQQIFFFNFFESKRENGQLGELDLGDPNISLIEKGTKIIELAQPYFLRTYVAASYKGLEFFGTTYISVYAVQFSWYNSGIQLPGNISSCFFQALRKQGIEYHFNGDIEVGLGAAWVTSIEKLQPLEFSLLQQDDTSFSITIQPSEYTERDARGRYYLKFREPPNPYKDRETIVIGYDLLKNYYVGFKKAGNKLLIAKKAQK